MNEIGPGLWRWTALHTTRQEPVGCVYWECDGQVCLIDPLVPPEAPKKFFSALDRDVARLGGTVWVLLTTPDHGRSSEEFVARYDAQLWAPTLDHTASNTDATPAWLEGHAGILPAGRPGEVIYWLAEHRTLVVGDVLRGSNRSDTATPARLCLAEVPNLDWEAVLDRILDLEVERILPAHGRPVLEKAGDELRSLASRTSPPR